MTGRYSYRNYQRFGLLPTTETSPVEAKAKVLSFRTNRLPPTETWPLSSTVKVLLDPSYPTYKLSLLFQSELLPVTITQLFDAPDL